MTAKTTPRAQPAPWLITFDTLSILLGGATRKQIATWQREHKFPAPVKLSRRLYWNSEDVKRWVKRQK